LTSESPKAPQFKKIHPRHVGYPGTVSKAYRALDSYTAMRLCWFRILPVVACVHEGFSLRINSGQVTDAFEMPLA
jgi:hypothetical protein